MDSVWTRLRLGFAAFFTILFQGRVPTELQPLASPPPVQVLSEPLGSGAARTVVAQAEIEVG